MFIHPTAEVSPRARLGDGTGLESKRRFGKMLSSEMRLRSAKIRTSTRASSSERAGQAQNGVYLYHGVIVEDGVFLGPRATTTNDRGCRAI